MSRQRASDIRAARARALRALCVVLGSALLGGCATPNGHPSAQTQAGTPAQDANREQRLRALQQAEALYLSGRLNEAQAAFEQLTQTYPRNGEMWFRLGNTLMKEGSYDAAAAALQNAASFDPGHGRAELNLALARIAQAQLALDAARARLDPSSPERNQADQLQRQIRTLLGSPGG
jgi:tetratricopeptide (TPR) repeat protein